MLGRGESFRILAPVVHIACPCHKYGNSMGFSLPIGSICVDIRREHHVATFCQAYFAWLELFHRKITCIYIDIHKTLGVA